MTPPLIISPEAPWLAPLAGYSDLPFRLLCREHGCHVAVTEMISAKGLIYGSPGTNELLATCARDTPLVVQLFGAEEEFLAQSVERLRAMGFVYFDLNCGCSVRKVTKTGSGAALLKDMPRLLRMAKAMIAAAGPLCVGFKIRLGWGHDQPIYLELSQALEQLGAGWITLHPRFATQGFTGTAEWFHLRRLKQHVSLPIIASGDLFSARDGICCVEETGVDGLMFARGALGDPTIFERFKLLWTKQPVAAKSYAGMSALVHRLSTLYTEHGMDRIGLLKMRTLVPRFLKGLPGARGLRRDIVFCSSWEDVFTALAAHLPTDHKEIHETDHR